jgi:ArsR family transcriptional regulator, lead/cadmium/zinc/bismuth-responsive transcriptional repressor
VKCVGPTTTEAEIERWKDGVLFSPQLDELAEFLNLVGNSTRLKIVFLLTEFKELCVCDLAQILDVTVPAVSQQLAKLKAFGLLKPRRENQTIFYSIADARNMKLLKERFDQILEQAQ